eukprot:844971-Amphidinium_carterae.1
MSIFHRPCGATSPTPAVPSTVTTPHSCAAPGCLDHRNHGLRPGQQQLQRLNQHQNSSNTHCNAPSSVTNVMASQFYTEYYILPCTRDWPSFAYGQ